MSVTVRILFARVSLSICHVQGLGKLAFAGVAGS